MPEVDWGITPDWGGTTRLARLIGRRMTKDAGSAIRKRREAALNFWVD